MVWPTTLRQEHQLVIKTPVGPWPQPVVSISQTRTASFEWFLCGLLEPSFSVAYNHAI
jgi:hypothetical protein